MITITAVTTDCTEQKTRELVGIFEHGEYEEAKKFSERLRSKDKQASRFHEYLKVKYIWDFNAEI